MFGKSNVAKALKIDIPVSTAMVDALELWTRIYENNAPWINQSTESKGPNDIYSMNLGSAIAGEIARAATIEMGIEVSGSERAEFIQSQIDRIFDKFRRQLEYGCAKGGLAMKPYVDGDMIRVDFVHADQFYPVSFDADGEITGAVFVDQRRQGEYYYTRLEYHQMGEYEDENGNQVFGCQVLNQAYRSSDAENLGVPVDLNMIDDWADISPDPVIIKGEMVDKPLFGYFRFPLANNVDSDSPLGVSCYARAVPTIREADYQWSRLLWEFEAGEMALYVDEQAFGRDKDNKTVMPNKRLYRSLGSSANIGELSGDDYFHDWAPTLREVSFLKGLDAILKRIEYQCGLAYGTLSDPQTVDKTATEIKISKQRTATTITDTQKAFEQALDQLIYAINVWTSIEGLAPEGNYEIGYNWDDSIIIDKELQKQQDLLDLGRGVMSKLEYRMRNHGETEEQARDKLSWVDQERQPAPVIPTEE